MNRGIGIAVVYSMMQLALYARAWELSFLAMRVVGIGVTEIGESTVHYLGNGPVCKQIFARCTNRERTYYSQKVHRYLESQSSEDIGLQR